MAGTAHAKTAQEDEAKPKSDWELLTAENVALQTISTTDETVVLKLLKFTVTRRISCRVGDKRAIIKQC